MERIRNKMGWGLSGALALLLLAALAGVVHGGPLDPTAPPGSTSKNVITSLPFGISQPGSYVLNGNLTGVSGQNGINITANNVTIDLQGFELVGVPGSLHGIAHISGSLSGLTVRNGTIRNWGQLGISAGLGVSVDSVSLKSNNGGVFASDGATLTNCRIEGSIGTSSILGNRAVVSKCTFDSNGPGCTNCPGIQVGQDSTITESVARNNGGIEIQAGAGSTLENCTADGNGTAGYGISVGLNSIVSNCTARNNGDSEIYALDRSLIENCVADGFTGTSNGAGDGIRVSDNTIVRGCTSQNNSGSGIVFGSNNRIESNHALFNTVAGITTQGQGLNNVVVLNSAHNNAPGLNYNISPASNQFTSGPVSGATNPWANIDY